MRKIVAYQYAKGEKFVWHGNIYEVVEEADLIGNMLIRDQHGKEYKFNSYVEVTSAGK